MAIVYLVQTVEERPGVRDPSLEVRTVDKADRAGRWLARARVAAVYTSPADQAWRMAAIIAARVGAVVHRDERVRDRLEWDGVEPAADFRAERARTEADRDYRPARGESSRAAGDRLRAFLLEERYHGAAPVAVVTHSGVTVDLLRTLMGDEALHPKVLREGITEGSITTLDGLTVVRIAQRPGTP